MSLKKKDLEIVYSLRWRNGPKKEDKKQMSIVAVYDIPATTLNFEVFKSYLLKNSGTAEDDVSVFYIMDSGKEYPIQSQTDFQVALYAFRRKARAGEVINILLERISDQPVHKNLRHSNDVETQSDTMEEQAIGSTGCNAEIPPEWFIAGLAQLKRDMNEEITANVLSIVSNAVADIKSPFVNPSLHHTVCLHRLKNKPEKQRLRRIAPHMTENASDVKDRMKSLKLESKLEKLELKASKYREKRLALQHGQKSSDSEAGQSSSRSRSRDKQCKVEEQQKHKNSAKVEEQQKHKDSEEPIMDARPVKVQKSIPHMLGGEIYLHQWEVQNTGHAPWTSMTQLQYAWGSKKLVPVEKTILVPYLEPGETGTVSTRLHIPTQTGAFECYWQFTHKGRRFGHWLGVKVIVDPFDLKGHYSVLKKSTPLDLDHEFKRQSEVNDSETPKRSSLGSNPSVVDLLAEDAELFDKLCRTSNDEEIDSDCSWSSEPTHFWSQVDEKGEFVVVPVPQCFVLDTPDSSDNNLIKKEVTPPKTGEPAKAVASASGIETEDKKKLDEADNFDDNNNTESVSGASGGSIKLRDEELDNIVVITVPKDAQVKEGFIYVHVDGQKVLIPKNILKSEVVTAAQELERSPSSANSIGVIIDANESLNKSPTPSVTSTITALNSIQPMPQKEDDHSGNTLDSVPIKILEKPIILQPTPMLESVAVDLSTASRENLDDGVDRSNYFEANNYMSHCSAAGSCFSEVNYSVERENNRVFVFPKDYPGYEVVYPVLDVNNPNYPNLTSEFMVPHNQPATAPYAAASPSYNIPQQQLPNPIVEPVPNYQQTPPEMRRAPVDIASEPILQELPGLQHPLADAQQHYEEEIARTRTVTEGIPEVVSGNASQVHILPETLVNGAVNVASSALNTARSVINMIKPQAPGRWVNGHWVSSSAETPREANLQALAEMGFWNRDLNATLLARFNDDLNRVVAELVQ